MVVRILLVVVGITWVIVAIAFLSGLVDSDSPAEEWMIGTGVVIGGLGFILSAAVGIAGAMLALGAVVASTYGAGWVLAGGAVMVLLGMLRLPGSRSADW